MGNLRQLEDERQRLLEASLAAKTHATYSAAWSKFVSFATIFERPITLPISVYDLSLFIAFLSKSNCASATARTYLAGISYWHKINGFQDFSKSFIIQKLIEGIKRQQERSFDPRLPITVEQLVAIIHALDRVCASDYEATLFKAVFTLSFFGFLRIGEVAAQSPSIVSDHVLRKSDIYFQIIDGVQVVFVNFRVSKNNQAGVHQSIIVSQQGDRRLCPVQALNAYLQQAPASPFLFTHFCGTPITRYQFSALLQKTIVFSNFPNHTLFKSHSFRIGAATTAKLLGFTDEQIQTMGRWRSCAFQRYIRIPQLH